MSNLFAGLDVGTTNVKCGIFTKNGNLKAISSIPTPWRHIGSAIEMLPLDLKRAVDYVFAEVQSQVTGHIEALGITGMAEAGVILSASNDPILPILAWNDSRPDVVLKNLFSDIDYQEFMGSTGLPISSRPTIAKLKWLKEEKALPLNARWVGVPEWISYLLGSRLISERSFASRTGLYDVIEDSWREDFQKLAFGHHILMPELVSTNDIVGIINKRDSIFDDSAIVIAGHDHICAAIGVGESNTWNIVDSMGTGEALSRLVPFEKLSKETIIQMVSEGMTIGRHPIPDHFAAMVGLSSGLILKNALALIGITGEFEESQNAIIKISTESLSVNKAPIFSDVKVETWNLTNDGIRYSDAEIWRGALDFVGRRASNGVHLLDKYFGQHQKIIACGGWLKNTAIRETKRIYLGDYETSEVLEPGCFGAALIASQVVGNHKMHLALNPNFSTNT